MIKKAFFVVSLLALAVAVPAFAQQDEFVASPSGGNGPSLNVGLRMAAENGDRNFGMSQYDPRYDHLSSNDKAALLDNGREMLRDIKRQLKNATSDEERAALLEKKRAIENAMIEVQQMN